MAQLQVSLSRTIGHPVLGLLSDLGAARAGILQLAAGVTAAVAIEGAVPADVSCSRALCWASLSCTGFLC